MRGGVRSGGSAFRASAGANAAPYAGTEHQHQAALVAWARLMVAAGQFPDLEWLFAVPNGGLRSAATAGKLRAEGVAAGVPDLVLPVPRGVFTGIFLEMKRPSEAGRGAKAATDDQHRWLWAMRERGFFSLIAFGCDAGRAALRWYLGGADANELLTVARFADGIPVAVGALPYPARPDAAPINPLLTLWTPDRSAA